MKELVCVWLLLMLMCVPAQAVVYDDAAVYEIIDSQNMVIGTQSVCCASSSECTKSAISEWYSGYCTDSGNAFNVIVYTDDPEYGVVNCGDCVYVDAQLYTADTGCGTFIMYDPTFASTVYIENQSTHRLRKAESDMQLYVLNVDTYKFHLAGCRMIARMLPENTSYYTGCYDDLTAYGYSPCGVCNPN